MTETLLAYHLPPEAMDVALSWLETRMADAEPEEDGYTTADVESWYQTLHTAYGGDGMAELPVRAWKIIADDIFAEADKDFDFNSDWSGNAYQSAKRQHAMYCGRLRKVADGLQVRLRRLN